MGKQWLWVASFFFFLNSSWLQWWWFLHMCPGENKNIFILVILHLYYICTTWSQICAPLHSSKNYSPECLFLQTFPFLHISTKMALSDLLTCQACGHDAFFCLLMKIGHLFYVWIYGSSSRNCTFIAFKWPSVSWGRRPFTGLGPDASGRVIKANTAASVIKLKAG